MNYDHFAQTFSKSRIDHPWPELDYLIRVMEKSGVKSVLDIGCGNGRFIEQIQNSKFKIQNYRGLDNSSVMIEEAQKLHPGYDFAVFDMLSLWVNTSAHHFEAILLLASFHHLETREDRLQVLRDMRQFLSPGGQIMMTNWNLRDQPRYTKSQRGDSDYAIKIGKHERYYHGFTMGELEELFLETGYMIRDNQIFEWGRNIVSIIS